METETTCLTLLISESTKNIYQLGAGMTGPGDSGNNLYQQLYLSKSKKQ
jgi:hypothetical protein